jgi:hypothetical protein
MFAGLIQNRYALKRIADQASAIPARYMPGTTATLPLPNQSQTPTGLSMRMKRLVETWNAQDHPETHYLRLAHFHTSGTNALGGRGNLVIAAAYK